MDDSDEPLHPYDVWPPPRKKKLTKTEKRQQILKPSPSYEARKDEDTDFIVYDADQPEIKEDVLPDEEKDEAEDKNK